MRSVLLIIPCFNEEKRLLTEMFLQSANENRQYLFANDGSSDRTSTILSEMKLKSSYIHIYDARQNKGKANVIRDAYLYASEHKLIEDFDYIGYWDADLATPLFEVENMLTYATFYNEKVDSIWGSRVYRLGSNIRRTAIRHYLGRVFATIMANLLKIKSYDTQCGAKLFTTESAIIAFKDPFISKWIFDIEILLRLKNFKIIEYPLRKWEDVPGSKINLKKDIIKVLKDIYNIWKKYKNL